MILPIYLDLAIAFCAIVAGLYVLLTKMRVVDNSIFTPILELVIVCCGSLSWAIYCFLALSAVTAYPPLHADGWVGHWGYTLARFFSFAFWVLTLLLITRYSAYMQFRKKSSTCK